MKSELNNNNFKVLFFNKIQRPTPKPTPEFIEYHPI